MIQRDESRHDFAFIAGVIVGAIAGALATLALTPMSGPETRERLRERAGDLGPVKERAATVAESAQHLVTTGRERASELAQRAPLPVPGRHAAEERDTMMAENPSQPRQHPDEPAEGRDDLNLAGADRDESATADTDGTRTPHPDDPAEGRRDVPGGDDQG